MIERVVKLFLNVNKTFCLHFELLYRVYKKVIILWSGLGHSKFNVKLLPQFEIPRFLAFEFHHDCKISRKIEQI